MKKRKYTDYGLIMIVTFMCFLLVFGFINQAPTGIQKGLKNPNYGKSVTKTVTVNRDCATFWRFHESLKDKALKWTDTRFGCKISY